jgi:hypothetical protein
MQPNKAQYRFQQVKLNQEKLTAGTRYYLLTLNNVGICACKGNIPNQRLVRRRNCCGLEKFVCHQNAHIADIRIIEYLKYPDAMHIRLILLVCAVLAGGTAGLLPAAETVIVNTATCWSSIAEQMQDVQSIL